MLSPGGRRIRLESSSRSGSAMDHTAPRRGCSGCWPVLVRIGMPALPALDVVLDRTRTLSTRTRRTRRICGGTVAVMPQTREREAATLLTDSEDTLRRCIVRGALTAQTDAPDPPIL